MMAQVLDMMLEKASYYRWLAMKGAPMAGNDPLTGKCKGYPMHARRPCDVAAWVAAHKAMARSYVQSAREYIRTYPVGKRLPVAMRDSQDGAR